MWDFIQPETQAHVFFIQKISIYCIECFVHRNIYIMLPEINNLLREANVQCCVTI